MNIEQLLNQKLLLQVDVPYDNHIVYSDKTRGIKLLQDHESYYRNQQTTALLTMLKKQVPGLNITGFFVLQS